MTELRNISQTGSARRVPGVGVVPHGATADVPEELVEGLLQTGQWERAEKKKEKAVSDRGGKR